MILSFPLIPVDIPENKKTNIYSFNTFVEWFLESKTLEKEFSTPITTTLNSFTANSFATVM